MGTRHIRVRATFNILSVSVQFYPIIDSFIAAKVPLFCRFSAAFPPLFRRLLTRQICGGNAALLRHFCGTLRHASFSYAASFSVYTVFLPYSDSSTIGIAHVQGHHDSTKGQMVSPKGSCMKADLKIADGTGTFNPLKRVVQWIDERVSMVRHVSVNGLTSTVQWFVACPSMD